jgi:chromosome segregation ATPase
LGSVPTIIIQDEPASESSVASVGNTGETASQQASSAPAKERLRALRELSERLGRSSYQLEVLLARTVKACLDRSSDLDLSVVPGGADIVQRVHQRELLEADLAAVVELIAARKAKRDEEVKPLDDRVGLEERQAERARSESEQARIEASERYARLSKSCDESRAAVDSSLQPLLPRTSPEDRAVELQKAPWNVWALALETSLVELRRRIPELDVERRTSEEADQHATKLESQARATESALEEALEQAKGRRTELQRELAELEARRDEASTRIELETAEIPALCEELLKQQFASADSPLERSRDFTEARQLSRDLDALRAEIAQLED